jgi:glutathione S-transferase
MMKLGNTALSPFCRKVRMAMEYKGLAFEIVTADHVAEAPAFNPRAEVPLLVDGDVVVCNSPDSLAYLDRKHPEPPLYPGRLRTPQRHRRSQAGPTCSCGVECCRKSPCADVA